MLEKQKLDLYTNKYGPGYGTEEFSKFLYSLARLHHPDVVLELGTGLGVTSFWMAQALKENNCGHIWTLDDGSDWKEHHQSRIQKDFKVVSTLKSFIKERAKDFGVQSQMTFVDAQLKPNDKFFAPSQLIDLLFADIHCGPLEVASMLSFYLPRMSTRGSIFIDRASTIVSTFLMIEFLVSELNRGRIPLTITDRIKSKKSLASLRRLVDSCRFKLVHITKQGASNQNSVAWLKIERNDFVVDEKVTRLEIF